MDFHILVVDDEPHFELIVKKTFRKQIQAKHYDFQFASDGEEALAIVEANPNIDLVLSDINMPRMDGLTLLSHLHQRFPLIKTVVISAYGDMSNIRSAMNGGASDFLIKPINLDDLRKTVKKTLKMAARDREYESARAERESARQKVVEHLRHMDRLKDEFLANISHELNTPLNGIIGLAESLRDGVAGEVTDMMAYNLDMLTSSGRRLASLVHDLLDFSKMKNSGLLLNRKPTNLHAVVDTVLALSRPLTIGKDLQLYNELPTDLPLVLGDEDRLEQVLHNLVGNAIKFTERGFVKVTAEFNQHMVTVAVSDTGIGIPEDKYDAIFHSFEQLDGTDTRLRPGVGLGLAITRKLVHLHDGEVTVNSLEGEGSTFRFTLPISDLAELDTPSQNNDGDATTATAHVSNFQPAPLTRPAVANTKRSTRILVADDEAVNLQVLTNRLNLEGYSVTAAINGDQTLQYLADDGPFDLLILDLMMPGKSGYDVCAEIRRKHSLFELPILILTAKTRPRDFIAALEAGANDYLPKPFDKRELLARVKTLLTLRRAVKDAIFHARRLQSEQRNRELSDHLRKLNESLTATLNLGEVLSRFLDSLVDVLPYNQGLIGLLRGGAPQVEVTRGFPADVTPESLAKMCKALFQTVREHGLIHYLDNPADTHDLTWLTSTDTAWLCVPIYNQNQVDGLVLLVRDSTRSFSAAECDLASSLAGQAAIAIDNARLFDRVQTMANVDGLTQINNRHYFFQLGRRAFEKSLLAGKPVAAIMMDIDHFKAFNDQYGHTTGDLILHAVAQTIASTCRGNDIVGRYGGEEFAALLPGTAEDDALRVAHRLREAVANESLHHDAYGELQVTISIGIATALPVTDGVHPGGGLTMDALIKRADEALLTAKTSGRNQVFYDDVSVS